MYFVRKRGHDITRYESYDTCSLINLSRITFLTQNCLKHGNVINSFVDIKQLYLYFFGAENSELFVCPYMSVIFTNFHCLSVYVRNFCKFPLFVCVCNVYLKVWSKLEVNNLHAMCVHSSYAASETVQPCDGKSKG